MSQQEPRFRRALIVVALVHVVLIAGLLWFFNRPVKKPSGQLTWMDTGSFSAPQETAAEPVIHSKTEPTPEMPKTHPTPLPIREDEKLAPEAPSEITLNRPTPTPTPVPNPATCAGACAQGLSLGCPWASQTPSGKTCEQVCANTAAILPWNVDCIAKAATCVAADACQAK